jgi:deoxyribonuclease-4
VAVFGIVASKIGFHVSIAGGISNSVDNAGEIGCTAFQIFSRNPRGWAAKALDDVDVALFKNKLSASGIKKDSVVVHMPYLPNLSGPPGELYEKSARTLAEELQRCSYLGIRYLVVHLGSHMGKGSDSGISQLSRAIANATHLLNDPQDRNSVTILLENNAGQKNSIGATFEELQTILGKVRGSGGDVGICLDTCHLFASGYDVRSCDNVEDTLETFDDVVGLRELKVVHLNDSKGKLGSNLDRHQHIGLGEIGLEGIAAFLNHAKIRNLPFIMETPIDDVRGDEENLKAVLALAGKDL